MDSRAHVHSVRSARSPIKNKSESPNAVGIVSLIKEFGPMNLGMPHIKFLGNKLWEIRLKGKNGIARALYTTMKGQKLVILHVFVKKTQKTPQTAINLAIKRMKEAL